MPKFRKKPIIIEAEQWFPGVEIDGLTEKTVMGLVGPYPVIDTLEGEMIVRPGDWIITGVNGERYPCKPDIFAKTYEPIDE